LKEYFNAQLIQQLEALGSLLHKLPGAEGTPLTPWSLPSPLASPKPQKTADEKDWIASGRYIIGAHASQSILSVWCSPYFKQDNDCMNAGLLVVLTSSSNGPYSHT